MQYGLVGEKLGHSFSKVIHEYFEDYNYELVEVKKENFESFILNKAFCGINVTIPYKETVLPYLDYIDEYAQKIGCVNTVLNKNGKLYGYNTDFSGLLMLIKRNNFDFFQKKVLILGTGGTSKTAYAVSKYLGSSEIYKVSRSGELNYTNVYKEHFDADFIINTTPCGMFPNNDSCAIDVSKFKNLSGVIDVVYNPIKTKLVLSAQKNGIKAVGGLYMLVAQAIFAAEIFTGKKYSDEVFEKTYKYILKKKENIVLIGMPGSGKSTIGKQLALRLKRKFIDTDSLVSEKYLMSIPEIFSKYSEEVFRDAETTAVKEASSANSAVIATGGGAVLRDENIEYLSSNGIIFFLNRPISDIVPTDDRPLSSNFEDLKKRFDERYSVYKNASDKEIAVNGSVDDAVNEILECMK